ncbi:MAG TPA: nicotinate phosphoribosyltransferase [Acidimicrobiia bacterium]|nr:nicotinate phosphoribosyltransferase [Acidimicrobiia bacterium]
MHRDVSHSLLVDLYELTMAVAYRGQGTAERPATFSLFVRTMPPHRGYLVAAGLDDALTWLEEFGYDDADLAALDRLGVFTDDELRWLGTLRFTGDVRAVPEGTLVFPDEPILEVDAPIAEAQLAETFLLNQVTVQTVLATKAARCRHAAAGRSVVDFALRRTHGIDAGMKLARVAAMVGLDATSNVAGSDRYGLRASGTMAHSYVEAHGDEERAFFDFATRFGERSVLLVDTYDSERGVTRAIDVCLELRERGTQVGAIRLDSGDLVSLARHARRRLDAAGLSDVGIFASGGLDEFEVDRLVRVEHAPIDGFGVGTALGVSADAPGLDSVYKLTAFDGRAVRKTSEGKATWPGAKQVWRSGDWSGDVLGRHEEDCPASGATALLVPVMRDGRRVVDTGLDAARVTFEREWAALPGVFKDLDRPPRYAVEPSVGLRDLTAAVDADQHGGS